MLTELFSIEKLLPGLFETVELRSMYIDYHKPFVSRIWFQFDKFRVYLHKIESAGESVDALYHPHPWKSAIRILKGTYEMGVGHSATENSPISDVVAHLTPGVAYEMVSQDGWHYVNPLNEPVYSLMITGELYDRKMPITPDKRFAELSKDVFFEILNVVDDYYGLNLDFDFFEKKYF